MRSRHKLHPLTSFTLSAAGPQIRFIAADYEGIISQIISQIMPKEYKQAIAQEKQNYSRY